MKFSQRLKKIRLEKKLTLQKLSDLTNGEVSVDAISKYELGTRMPKMDAVITLANALGVTLEYLTGGEVRRVEKENYINSILKKYDLETLFMNVDKMSNEDLAKFESDIVIMLKVLKEKYLMNTS